MFSLPAPIPLNQATEPGWYLEVLKFQVGKVPAAGSFIQLKNENTWHTAQGSQHRHKNKSLQVIGPLDLSRFGIQSQRAELSNDAGWVKSLAQAKAGTLVSSPVAGFSLITSGQGASQLSGHALKDGDQLVVQFAENSQIQLPVRLGADGLAYHRSWWAGVPTLVPLQGLYAKRA